MNFLKSEPRSLDEALTTNQLKMKKNKSPLKAELRHMTFKADNMELIARILWNITGKAISSEVLSDEFLFKKKYMNATDKK